MMLLTAYDNPCSATLVSPTNLNSIMLQISCNANASLAVGATRVYIQNHILSFLGAFSSEYLLKILLQCCL